MRTFATTMMLASSMMIVGACGTDDGNNGPSNNGGTNNGAASNNGAATNNAANSNNDEPTQEPTASGSCFHNCVSQGPLGDIENFGCVAPSSDGECPTDAQAQCDGAGWGTAAASEYVADCASCSESCAPDFYDCSSAACITDTN